MSRCHLALLSDDELVARLEAFVRRERTTTLAILEHIGEVGERRLHLEHGYPSLFAWCTGALGYSRSAAGRRVQAARSLRRFPDIRTMFESREISLTTLCLVAGVLKEQNRAYLLAAIRGKSQEEVEKIVAMYRPREVLRDRVRPVCVRVPVALGALDPTAPATSPGELTQPTSNNALALPANPSSEPARCVSNVAGNIHAGDTGARAESPCEQSAHERTQLKQKVLIQFAVDPEFMKKLEAVRALVSTRIRDCVTLEALFDATLESYLDKHSRVRRHERRVRRRARSERAAQTQAAGPAA